MGPGVEEYEAGQVHRPALLLKRKAVEGLAHLVDSEDVEPTVANECGDADHGVQHPLDARPEFLRCWLRRSSRRGRRGRGLRQVDQVDAFGLVELQGGDQRLKHRLRDPAEVAPLQPRVVLDTDTSQLSDLGSTQPRHTAGTRLDNPTCSGLSRARREVRNARTSARLSMVATLRAFQASLGVPAGTPQSTMPSPKRKRGLVVRTARRWGCR